MSNLQVILVRILERWRRMAQKPTIARERGYVAQKAYCLRSQQKALGEYLSIGLLLALETLLGSIGPYSKVSGEAGCVLPQLWIDI